MLKNLGLVIGRAKLNVFAVRAEELIEGCPELMAAARPLLAARNAIEQQIDDLDDPAAAAGAAHLIAAAARASYPLLAPACVCRAERHREDKLLGLPYKLDDSPLGSLFSTRSAR